MARNLFIGSLSYSCTDEDLRQHFERVGPVRSAKVILDRETNRSRGFGFVDMEHEEDAERAISQIDGSSFMGRTINVRVANPRPERPRHDRRYEPNAG